ncbi:MAG: hypothetical protein KDK64_06680 [Chlamydiia bacterium]|nr:hypothetical protein [Chlamydiia bacterium]
MKFRHLVFKNWWVVAFVLMAGAIYLQAIHKKNQRLAALKEKVETLAAAKIVALERKEELLLRLGSQHDPDFIELVLKEKLGVLAEGETKVVFQ